MDVHEHVWRTMPAGHQCMYECGQLIKLRVQACYAIIIFIFVLLTIIIATMMTGTLTSQRKPIMMNIPPAAVSQSVRGSF